MKQEKVNKRNYGIDLLRIIAMFFVLILHIVGKGGILLGVKDNETKFAITCFIQIGVYCAVNCYALISGFVYFSEEDKPLKISNYISLWLQVVFYNVMITLIFWKFWPRLIGIKQLVKSFFPVASNQYWYFSAYTGVFFMIPWLNKIVRSSKKEKLKTVMICMLGFSCYVTIANLFTFEGDPFGLNAGYSFLWLAILYLMGAYIKKYEIFNKLNKKKTVLIGIFLLIVTWIWKIEIGELTMYFFGKKIMTDLLISYTSPTILGIAIIMLLIFAKLEIKPFWYKLIRFVTVSSFGVYLIHVQPLVFDNIIGEKFSYIANLPAYLILPAIIGLTIIIFTIGIFIDKVRILVFRFLKFSKLSEQIEKKIRTFAYKLENREKITD